MKSVTKDRRDVRVYYCPHGMNFNWYYPITEEKELKELADFRSDLIKSADNVKKDFIILWVNRNIRRKQPGDVILAYKVFCDGLTKEEADRCMLIMHTQPIDTNGTDLYAVKNRICPDYPVLFSAGHMDEKHMNFLHNISDVMLNIANNEGFGLTTCESLAAGTPIIVNVTGGLQDQCGFKWVDGPRSGEELTADDYIQIGSLHNWKKWEAAVEYGDWVKPVWPRVRSLNGSPPTPYIFDDRVDFEEVAEALRYWWDMEPKDRQAAGMLGHEWVKNGTLSQENMCNVFMDAIDTTIEKFKPVDRFKMFKI